MQQSPTCCSTLCYPAGHIKEDHAISCKPQQPLKPSLKALGPASQFINWSAGSSRAGKLAYHNTESRLQTDNSISRL